VVQGLSRHHLLDPTNGIEAPTPQIFSGLLEPFFHAVAVLVAPDMRVFSVAQCRRIDVIQTYGKESLAFGAD